MHGHRRTVGRGLVGICAALMVTAFPARAADQPTAYFEWDAALDAGGDDTWPSTGTDTSYTWTFDAGAQTPADVTGGRFCNITKAYAFPGALVLNSPDWTPHGDQEPATFEFVIDVDADDGLFFESGGGTGSGFSIIGGVIGGYCNDESVTYTPTAEEKDDFLHVVFVLDMAGDVFQLYVDGELKDSVAWTDTDWTGTDNAGLGGSSSQVKGGAPGDLVGKMAIFRFYRNQALTQPEIELLYNLLGLNAPPTVTLETPPTEGQKFASGVASITLKATANDDSAVNAVEFQADGAWIGDGVWNDPTWDFTWTLPADGAHALTAVATDDNTATTESDPINITVGPVITVEATDATATENGDGGMFTITRTAPDNSGDIVVDFSMSGDAAEGAGNDYTLSTSGSATIPDGQWSVDVTLMTEDDATYEEDEDAIITLDSTDVGMLGATKTAMITIVDNELPPPTAYFEWDAALDAGGDDTWPSTGTDTSYAWTFDAGVQTPVDVTSKRFFNITKAYAFPGALDERSPDWTPHGDQESATFEFVIDVDSDDGLFFESGGGTGSGFSIIGGVIGGYCNDTTVTYTPTAEEKSDFLHVVFVLDMAGDVFQLYIDGVLKDSVAWTDTDWTGTDDAGLGGSSTQVKGGDPGNFTGKMAIFRYYRNQALIPEEIELLFDLLGLNQPPDVNLTAPTEGQKFASGVASITLKATATDDSAVDAVEFRADGAWIGDGVWNDPTWDFTWTLPADGAHALTVVATDDNTATTESDPINITVGLVITVEATDTTATENGDGGVFTITRTAPDNSGDIVVDFSMSGDASAGDYTLDPSGGAITIGDGSPTATVTLTTVDDDTCEFDEDAVITLDSTDVGTLGSTLTATVTIADDDTDPGLVAWYRLDRDGADTEVIDSSANGYDGTLTGDPTWDVSGQIGGALNFDGSDDYVELPTSMLGSDVGTFSAWIRPTKRGILFYGADATGKNGFGEANELHVGFTPGEQLQFWAEGGAGDVSITSSASYNDRYWHHVAATWDTAGNAVLYVDGAEVGSALHTANSFQFSALTRLGRVGQEVHFYRGDLDDVRLYNRALDAAEVLTLYCEGFPPLAITSPLASATSPVWVEGDFRPEASSVTVLLNGNALDVVNESPYRWYADDPVAPGALGIPLTQADPDAELVIESREEGGAVVDTITRTITWTATDIAGKSYSMDSIVIRKGDSLLLTATGSGDLTIDAHGDGTFEHTGLAGDTFAALYDTPGNFVAEAKVDDVSVGTLTVTVVEVDLHAPIATMIGYTREKNVAVNPVSMLDTPAQVVFMPNDPALLEVSLNGPSDDVEVVGASLLLTAFDRGTPALQARLGGPTGPVIAECEVEEFTIDTPHADHSAFAVHEDGSLVGPFTFTINPWPVSITRLEVVSRQGATVDGEQVLDLEPADLDADGKFVGEWELDDVDTTLCEIISTFQASSDEKECGGSGLLNPGKCAITVKGGFYLAREMSDETERENEDNLEAAPGAGPDDPDSKQIHQVWDKSLGHDGRWTSDVKAEGTSSEQLEAAFFSKPGDTMPTACRPSRWYTSKVTKNDCGAQFGTLLIPYEAEGGKYIPDNDNEQRDEVTKNEGVCSWVAGKPDAIPGNVPANHNNEKFCFDHNGNRRSYDTTFSVSSDLPQYTDHGFFKGNMIGSFDVIAACHAITMSPVPKKLVNARSGTHGHTDTDQPYAPWAGDELTFSKIITVGRLEADGYTADDKDGDGELDEQNEDVNGNGVLDYADDTDGDGVPDAGGEDLDGDGNLDVKETDTSSRDRFADVVGANVYDYEFEVTPDDPETPEVNEQVLHTYVRTNHDGAAGIANPVPVHITFRAPPGETVKAAVTISTDTSKKTHKAWIALSDGKIFEYRGLDRNDLSEDQKAEEVYDLELDSDGNIVDEEPAERVVTLVLTAGQDWFAEGVVYVYGIEASMQLDDIKLAVWGEERMDWKAKGIGSQAHHNQDKELVDEEPLPIKRWYITDEEPVNVVKIEYAVPSDGEGLEVTDIIPGSFPSPVVTLQAISPASIEVTEDCGVTLDISGTVEDDLLNITACDPIPATVTVFVNGTEVDSIDVTWNTAADSFWKPHARTGSFSKTVSFDGVVGPNTVDITTAENLAGNTGTDSLVIHIRQDTSATYTPAPAPPPPELPPPPPVTLAVSVQFSGDLSETAIDTVDVKLLGEESWTVFTETSVASKVFAQTSHPGSYSEIEILGSGTFDANDFDDMDMRLTRDGEDEYVNFEETWTDTKLLTHMETSFEAIRFVSAPNPTQIDTLYYNRSALADEVAFTETGVDTLVFEQTAVPSVFSCIELVDYEATSPDALDTISLRMTFEGLVCLDDYRETSLNSLIFRASVFSIGAEYVPAYGSPSEGGELSVDTDVSYVVEGVDEVAGTDPGSFTPFVVVCTPKDAIMGLQGRLGGTTYDVVECSLDTSRAVFASEGEPVVSTFLLRSPTTASDNLFVVGNEPTAEVDDAKAYVGAAFFSSVPSPRYGFAGETKSIDISLHSQDSIGFGEEGTVSFGDGIAVTVTSWSETSISVGVEIASDAQPGTRTVEITKANGAVVRLTNWFCVFCAKITHISFAPGSSGVPVYRSPEREGTPYEKTDPDYWSAPEWYSDEESIRWQYAPGADSATVYPAAYVRNTAVGEMEVGMQLTPRPSSIKSYEDKGITFGLNGEYDLGGGSKMVFGIPNGWTDTQSSVFFVTLQSTDLDLHRLLYKRSRDHVYGPSPHLRVVLRAQASAERRFQRTEPPH